MIGIGGLLPGSDSFGCSEVGDLSFKKHSNLPKSPLLRKPHRSPKEFRAQGASTTPPYFWCRRLAISTLDVGLLWTSLALGCLRVALA